MNPRRIAWWAGPFAVTAALLAGAGGCGEDPAAPIDSAKLQAIVEAFGLVPLPEIAHPQYNRRVPERVALGKLLFFDPILGGESAPWVKTAAGREPYRDRASEIACATCHHPQFAFGDARRISAGAGAGDASGLSLGPLRAPTGRSLVTGANIPPVARNALTILNTTFNGFESPDPPDVDSDKSFQFIDGRVTNGLEQQVHAPLPVREELAGDAYGTNVQSDAVRDTIVARIRNIPGYEDLFRSAFPGEVDEASDITINHIGKAIAAYERELVTPGSRYDRFVSGEFSALSAEERLGFELFFDKGVCGDCHFGPMLSDYSFHVQGVADDYDAVLPGFPGKDGQGHDLGRFHADPTQFEDRKYAFRTLTIRNAERTAPYFHSGSAETLEEVVAFYNRGGLGSEDVSDAVLQAAGAVRSPSIRPLELTEEEVRAIVAFMKTTTGTIPPGPGGIDLVKVPSRVPSGLLPPGIPTPPGSGPFLPEDMP